MAKINLCDCVEGWFKNIEAQQAIGEVELEKAYCRVPPALLLLSTPIFSCVEAHATSRYYSPGRPHARPDDVDAIRLKAHTC